MKRTERWAAANAAAKRLEQHEHRLRDLKPQVQKLSEDLRRALAQAAYHERAIHVCVAVMAADALGAAERSAERLAAWPLDPPAAVAEGAPPGVCPLYPRANSPCPVWAKRQPRE